MTTSGVSTFNLVTNELIDEAYDLIGIGSEGEAITADMYARAKRSANLIIKSWGAKPHLWLKTERSVTLIADTASYALTPKPMRVTSVRRRITTGALDTPMNELAREEYFDMPNKTQSSVPVSFYYDPQATTGTLYVWPRPSAATAASMTLQLTYLRRMEDFVGSSDDGDFPQEWLEAFTTALAVPLARKYAPDRLTEAKALADELFANLSGFDHEPASLYLQPDCR
jgi:hypothetical protein